MSAGGSGSSSRIILKGLKHSRRSVVSRCAERSNASGGAFNSARSLTTSSSGPSTRARSLLSSSSSRSAPVAQSILSSSRSLFSTYSTPNTPAAPHLNASPVAATETSPISPTSSSEQVVFATEDAPSSPAVEDASADSEWAISYLSHLLPSLPTPFPPHVAKRIMTHQSYQLGASTYGHNARLSFLGRQVLKAYLLMHLQATVPATVLAGPGAGGSSVALGAPRDGADGEGVMTIDGWMDFDAVVDRVLGPKELGRTIAPVWGLETNARWTSPVAPKLQDADQAHRRLYRAGRDKVLGTTVEAVIGGIFHQFGGLEAYSIFATQILPNLDLPASLASVPGSNEETRSGSKGLSDIFAGVRSSNAASQTQRRRAVA